MEWDNVIIAIVMALPPIIAPIIAGRKDLREHEAAEAHSAAAEWQALYETCQKRCEFLTNENKELRAKLDAEHLLVIELRERLSQSKPIRRNKEG